MLHTNLILGSIGVLAAETVHLSAWSTPDQTIPLQGLVILNMLLELAQGVTSRGALGSSAHERHGKVLGWVV